MKLHLPKTLLTAVLAAVMAMPALHAETYNLLESSSNWTLSCRDGENHNHAPTFITSEAGNSITMTKINADWKQDLATYQLDNRYVYCGDSITFTAQYTMPTGANTNDAVLTLGLIGTENVFVFGTLGYKNNTSGSTKIGYGTSTDTSADLYLGDNGSGGAAANWDLRTEGVITNFETLKTDDTDITRTKGNYTLTGTVTLSNGSYLLDLWLTMPGETEAVQYLDNINLGTSFDINRVYLAYDGKDGDNAKLTTLTIDAQKHYAGYLTTVSGEATAANTSWTYKGNSTSYDDIVMDGTAWIGLKGSGESASIDFSDSVNLARIDVLEGAVILNSNGTLSTQNIVISDGASLKINIAQNSIFSYGGTDLSLLSKTTGKGKFSYLKSDTELRYNEGLSSDFAGTVDIAEKTKLYLGNHQDKVHTLSNLTIQLNEGSYFEIQGKNSALGGLHAAGTSKLKFQDGIADTPLLSIGKLSIAKGKTFTVENSWEGDFEVINLSAEGQFDINLDGQMSTVIQSIEKSGAINNLKSGHTLTLGEGSGSLLQLGGNVSNAGTLNIKGQLAGSSTIAGGTINIIKSASVSGSITFGSAVNMESVLSNTGTLILNGNVIVSNINQLKSTGEVTYSDNNGLDGFITKGTYYVVQSEGAGKATANDGVQLFIGNEEAGAITSSGASLVVEIDNKNATSGTYYVNTKDFTVDGKESNAAASATGYQIAKGRSLILEKNQNTTMTASKILAEARGEGNITVNASFDYNGSSTATGTLTINEGKTLNIGKGSNNTSNVSSFSTIVLDGGTIAFNGKSQTLGGLEINKASTFSMANSNTSRSEYTISKSTDLKAALTVTSPTEEKGTLHLSSLKGSGNLLVNGGSRWGNVLVNIKALDDYSGAIIVDGGGRSGDTRNSVVIDTDSDSYITSVELSNSGILNYYADSGPYSNTIGSVKVSGSATISMAPAIGYYQGEVIIEELKNGTTEDGVTIAGDLDLISNFRNSSRATFNLNDGNFTGQINLKGESGSATRRRIALNIDDCDVTANTIINVIKNENVEEMGIGIGAEKVKVAGINSSDAVTIVSGAQEYNKDAAFASEEKSRTLSISTREGDNHTANATIKGYINIEKAGAGKQTFAGNMSDFSGAISATAGELAFTAAEALNVSNLSMNKEGTLSVSTNGVNGEILAMGKVTLAGGATINGDLNLRSAQNVVFNVTTGSAPIVLHGSLTMESSEDFVDALAALSQRSNVEELEIFKGLTSLVVGNDTYTESFSKVDLNTWSSAVAANQYYLEFRVVEEQGSLFISSMNVVPEPTTATLSLLALAGLAARRRRE